MSKITAAEMTEYVRLQKEVADIEAKAKPLKAKAGAIALKALEFLRTQKEANGRTEARRGDVRISLEEKPGNTAWKPLALKLLKGKKPPVAAAVTKLVITTI